MVTVARPQPQPGPKESSVLDDSIRLLANFFTTVHVHTHIVSVASFIEARWAGGLEVDTTTYRPHLYICTHTYVDRYISLQSRDVQTPVHFIPLFLKAVMFRPHSPGTFCRIWNEGKFACEVHEEYHDVDGTILACKYCRWEAGKYDGRNYIRDPLYG